MADTVIVARLFEPEEALRICHELDAVGIDVVYDRPTDTGNYIFDWNVTTPQFIVSVPPEQFDQATETLRILEQQLENSDEFDEPSPEDFETEVEAGRAGQEAGFYEDEEPADSDEIRRVLNVAIVCWLLGPLVFYAIWRVIKSADRIETSADQRRFVTATLLTIFCPFWYWVLLLALGRF